MPFVNTLEDHANHPLARHIPWKIWSHREFHYSASESELARTEGTLEACSVPLLPDEIPLKALLCLAYGHQELPALPLLDAARKMGCNDNTIASAAAVSGNLDLLKAIIEGKTAREIKELLLSIDQHGIYEQAAIHNQLNILIWLDTVMSETYQRMIRGSDSLYCNVAIYSNLDVLIHLECGMVDHVRRAIRKRTYPFVVSHCKLEVMIYLESEMNEEEKKELCLANYPKAYYTAARLGHLDKLMYIESQMTETQIKDACSADNYEAYCVAAEYGHLEVITHFETLMTDAERKNARAATGREFNYCHIKKQYKPYRRALENGHLPVLIYLDEHMENNARMNVLSANSYEAYQRLYQGDRLDIIQYLESLMDEQQRKMARLYRGSEVYITAAGNSLNILKHLEQQMDDEERKWALSNGDYSAYRFAAKKGRIEIMMHLEGQMDAEERKRALSSGDYSAYRFAAQKGRIEIMVHLEGQMDAEELKAARSADSFYAYRAAAKYGLLDILKHLEEQMSDEERAEARSAYGPDGNYYSLTQPYHAYLSAAENGHMDILLYLEGQMSDNEKTLTLRCTGISAFRRAVSKEYRVIQDHFLCIPEIFAWAEEQETEYSNIVYPFVQNQLAILHSAHDDFKTSNPNSVFNLVDRDCMQGFFLARNLIRQNTAEILDKLRFLLAIPGIALMADHNDNELLRLACSLKNRGAFDILLTLDCVRDSAQLQGSPTLQEIEADCESSKSALAPVELAHCQGVLILEGELRSFVSEYFKTKIDASNIKLLKQIRNTWMGRERLTEEQEKIIKGLDISAVDQDTFLRAMQQKYPNLWSLECEGYLTDNFALNENENHVTRLWMLVDFNNLLNTVEMAGHYYLHRDRNNHAFAVSGSNLEDEYVGLRALTGDRLKLALLENFEKKLRETVDKDEFVNAVELIAHSGALAKLKQGQGITTRFFQLKTDSMAVFEDIIEDIGNQKGMTADEIRNLIENVLDTPTAPTDKPTYRGHAA